MKREHSGIRELSGLRKNSGKRTIFGGSAIKRRTLVVELLAASAEPLMLTNTTAEPSGEDAAVALMMKVRAEGCQVSFDRLVHDWRSPVERLCFRMCGNQLDAEDLTQEVFQKLYTNRARYEPTAKFSTYLWSIAANHCRDFLRSRRRQPVAQSDPQIFEALAQEADPTTLDRDSRQLIRDALNRLPQPFREVVVLRHYQHMKFEEIGRMLQIPRGTVASRMAKALKLLERELAAIDLPFSPNQE